MSQLNFCCGSTSLSSYYFEFSHTRLLSIGVLHDRPARVQTWELSSLARLEQLHKVEKYFPDINPWLYLRISTWEHKKWECMQLSNQTNKIQIGDIMIFVCNYGRVNQWGSIEHEKLSLPQDQFHIISTSAQTNSFSIGLSCFNVSLCVAEQKASHLK